MHKEIQYRVVLLYWHKCIRYLIHLLSITNKLFKILCLVGQHKSSPVRRLQKIPLIHIHNDIQLHNYVAKSHPVSALDALPLVTSKSGTTNPTPALSPWPIMRQKEPAWSGFSSSACGASFLCKTVSPKLLRG